MASQVKLEGLNSDEFEGCDGANTTAAQESLKARLSRKRTKTGCLTCRKRRIKCGEEHPVCRNCVKSKRHCEGYNQRVVFKQPFFDYRPGPNGAAHITFQAGTEPGPSTPFYADFAHAPLGYPLHAQLQPRPVEHFVSYADQVHPRVPPPPPPLQTTLPEDPIYVYPGMFAAPLSVPIAPIQQPVVPPGVAFEQPFNIGQYAHPDDGLHGAPATFEARTFLETGLGGSNGYGYGILPPNGAPHTPPTQPSPPNGPKMQWIQEDPAAAIRSANSQGQAAPPAAQPPPAQDHPRESPARPPVLPAYIPRPELCTPIDYQPPSMSNGLPQSYPTPQHSAHSFAPAVQTTTPDFYEQEFHVPQTQSPTLLLNQAAVEVHDVDYYDVDTDEEMDIDAPALTATAHGPQQALGRILQRNNITIQDMQTRRYDTFLYSGMLDIYRVDEHANPLRNPATARVFAHFIAVTGPSLSIFERHPRNTSVLFTSGQVPFSQQGLWTYTMPQAALRNQGLLHAMLAMASLHIARLTGASVTPSLSHYAWALKRIHHCVGHKKKRLNITTIAATMLLGFYEIMTADHMKWNMHLAGAKQLFVETDFVGMMQQFCLMREEAVVQERTGQRRRSETQSYLSTHEHLLQMPAVDERIVSSFVGKEVRYGGDHGQVVTPQLSAPQKLDLSKFEILKDLYWWYCKQDVYQSIISGNNLLWVHQPLVTLLLC